MTDNGNVMMATAPVIEGSRVSAPAPETVLRVALDVLTARAARWLSLLMSFTLFGAAVYYPDWKRLAAAGGFALVIHAPMWWRKD
jgi:hypothetical protein